MHKRLIKPFINSYQPLNLRIDTCCHALHRKSPPSCSLYSQISLASFFLARVLSFLINLMFHVHQGMGKTTYLKSDSKVYYSTILPSISNARAGHGICFGGSRINGVDFRGYAFWRRWTDLPRWPTIIQLSHHFIYFLLYVFLPISRFSSSLSIFHLPSL